MRRDQLNLIRMSAGEFAEYERGLAEVRQIRREIAVETAFYRKENRATRGLLDEHERRRAYETRLILARVCPTLTEDDVLQAIYG